MSEDGFQYLGCISAVEMYRIWSAGLDMFGDPESLKTGPGRVAIGLAIQETAESRRPVIEAIGSFARAINP